MTGFQRGGRGKASAMFFSLTMLFTTLSFLVTAGPSASASTLGSKFDGTDGSPTDDLAVGAVDYPDPFGNTDTSNYGNGPTNTEDSNCPPIAKGTAAPKDDLDHFYFGSESNDTGVFAYMAWHRGATTGTTTIDFELDHNAVPASNCNGVNPLRQNGDLLITYDFQGSGPFTIDISAREWNATTKLWGPPQALPAGSFEDSISANGAFGEMVVNLKSAGLLSTVGCDSFSSVFPKTRSSSSSFTNSMKDFVPPKTATVSNCGSVKVHKQDDTGAAMQGVQFDLYTSVNGQPGVPVVPAQNCTTDGNGDCTINNVFPGSYFVVEDAVPQGYTGEAPKPVAVTVGNTATVTFVNTRKPDTLKIVKHDDTGATLNGAVFTLYSGGTATNKTCTTGATGPGTCTISNILPPGTYTVKETTVPAGYTAAADQDVTFSGLDQIITLPPFVDTRKPATVNIIKQDDTGALIDGAGFTLYTDNNNAPGSAVSGKTCTTGAANGTGPGTCSITGILPPGTYWVVETTTPKGYDTADPKKVTLDLDQTVTLTFTDTRRPAQVNIIKRDDNGDLLDGAVFKLYTDDNGAPGSAVAGKSCTTGSAGGTGPGTCSITGILPPGTYWVVETTTPKGYDTADPKQVTLTLDETVTLPAFIDNRQPATVDIIKKDDAGNLLDGAGFTLYTDNNGQVGTAVANKTCSTTNGTCSITGILPAATYWVVETTTPKGYDTADPQQVTLGLNQTVTLTFFDNRQPASVNIIKKDDAGNLLDGAVFGLYTDSNDAPGSAVAGKTCTTGTASGTGPGTCTIGGILPPGTYWVVETTTPSSYHTADPQKVTLDLNQTVTLTFRDPRKSLGISLVKQVNDQHTTQADPLVVESGSDVTYTVTITNTGELPLTITDLTDSLNADFASSCSQGIESTLDVGKSFTCSYTSTITAPAHNVASVTATDPLDRSTGATDDAFVQPIKPVIALSKTGPSAAHVGDAVEYTFTVTNPGDTGLSDVTLTDSKCTTPPALQTKAGGNDDNVLDPGETWTYTCPYTVTAADGTSVKNTADVKGTDVLGTTVTSESSFTFPVLHPAITIDKTANPTSASPGQTVTYSYKVTNTGDTTLYNIVVTDDILGTIGTIDSLAPGASTTLTKSVVIANNSPTTNVGAAAGKDVLGEEVKATDTQTIAIVLPEVITRQAPPTLPRTGAMLLRETWWALLLIAVGALLRLASRKRKAIGDRTW